MAMILDCLVIDGTVQVIQCVATAAYGGTLVAKAVGETPNPSFFLPSLMFLRSLQLQVVYPFSIFLPPFRMKWHAILASSVK